MQVITEVELLDRIRAFLARHDMAPTTFGRKATGEPQIISSIEGGRSPSLKVVNRMVAFMAEQDGLLPPPTPPPPPQAADGEDGQLPFGHAPVTKRTGASSPICSKTPAPPPQPAASGSSATSCSADSAPVAAPSNQPKAAAA